jgi:hypothetical protein
MAEMAYEVLRYRNRIIWVEPEPYQEAVSTQYPAPVLRSRVI